ncbi:MAG: hypothetical protein Q9227_005476 [Pyrenula ochraceoflavens]
MPGLNQSSLSMEDLVNRSSTHAKVLHESIESLIQYSYHLPVVKDSSGNFHSAYGFLRNSLHSLEKPEATLRDLSTLDIKALKSIFNLIVIDIADQLTPVLDKLAFVAENFEEFYYKYVDSSLRNTRNAHSIVTQGIFSLQRSLKEIRSQKTMLSAAAYSSASSSSLSLCPGSIKLINGKDTGSLAPVTSRSAEYLSKKNRELHRQGKGFFLWWECSHCAFRSEYFVRDSATSTLLLSTRTEQPSGVSDMSYREILFPISHLHCDRDPHEYSENHPVLGCPICVAEGKDLKKKSNAFRLRKDLLQHIRNHHFDTLPADLILKRLKIAVDEQKPEKGTYDLHFRRPDVEVVDAAIPRGGRS